MKGTFKADPIVKRKGTLSIDGLPPIYFRSVGAIEQEISSATDPDQNMHSTGTKTAIEIDVEVPMHHAAEIVAIEGWYGQCATGSPGYKRDGQIEFAGANDAPQAIYQLTGVWMKKRGLPDLDRESDDLAYMTVGLAIDDAPKLV